VRDAVAMLEVAAVAALVLALIGLGLGVAAERRDEAADLFDLEAQGLAPASLRRQLRLRAFAVAAGGVVGGVVTALALSVLVVGFVELTANAGLPNPPLVLAVDWPVVLIAAVTATLLATALVVVITGRAFRRATPERYG
jgi:ABC-type antimicrobial peptide transport system permease subunit